ncbi:alpha/beta hydrolase [soil metagenome]
MNTVRLRDGRELVVHDTGLADAALTVVWHHGSPQTGGLLEPLVRSATARGIRLVSYGRPSYGGSTPNPGRSVASAARDVEQLADALGIERFAVMGASGGGPHALACAAVLPDRVLAAATLAGIAPLQSPGLDFFAGMADPGGLRAAQNGRDARAQFELTAVFDERSFTVGDYAALGGSWAALNHDVGVAAKVGPHGLIDDDVAFVSDWGFTIDAVAVPVLLAQGGDDRVVPPAHARWMLDRLPDAELWLRPRAGHISILDSAPLAFAWLHSKTVLEPAPDTLK